MVAEKGADIVRGRVSSSEHTEPWIDPEWQSRQRPGSAKRGDIV